MGDKVTVPGYPVRDLNGTLRRRELLKSFFYLRLQGEAI